MSDSPTRRLAPGDTAPEIVLADAGGQRFSLRALRGQPVIVYFYPRAATPGCTTEACDFRDSLSSLAAAGYAVIGISPDSVAEIAAFAAAEGLTFPLLADSDAATAQAWGAWGSRVVAGRGAEGVIRSTFVLDEQGLVRSAEYGVDAEGHVARLRADLGIDRGDRLTTHHA